MPRSNVDAATAAAVQQAWQWFLRFDFAAPLRYTDDPRGFTGNVDGTSQTWPFRIFLPGNLDQSSTDPMNVSTISMSNIDNVWSPIIFGSTTPRGVLASLYLVEYDPTDLVTIKSKPLYYQGVIDSAELDGTWIKIALAPAPSYWALDILPTIEPRCMYDYKDPFTCQSTSPDPTCDRTRAACAGHTGGSNLPHFGGSDLMPRTDLLIPFGSTFLQPPTGVPGVPPVIPPPIAPPVPPMPPAPGPVRPPPIVIGPR